MIAAVETTNTESASTTIAFVRDVRDVGSGRALTCCASAMAGARGAAHAEAVESMRPLRARDEVESWEESGERAVIFLLKVFYWRAFSSINDPQCPSIKDFLNHFSQNGLQGFNVPIVAHTSPMRFTPRCETSRGTAPQDFG
jgi:hypothetical protein